jgi:hypothetical protein
MPFPAVRQLSQKYVYQATNLYQQGITVCLQNSVPISVNLLQHLMIRSILSNSWKNIKLCKV